MSRERVVRTLTFWLRPEFVLRVVSRFQKVAGFDRSIALASSALTATIPLAIIASSLSSQLGGRETAERVIDRYELTGGGAEAVTDVFSPPSGTSTSIGIVGVFFVLIAVLSFTRAVQRLFELTWELEPLSVRNTFNGLLWIGGLSAWIFVSGAIHAVLGRGRLELVATLVIVPLSVRVPALERPDAQRQAHPARRPASVRRHRAGTVRGVLGRGRRCTCRTSSAPTPRATA